MASILKSLVKGIPALFGLNPVSNFLGLTVSPYEGGPTPQTAPLSAEPLHPGPMDAKPTPKDS